MPPVILTAVGIQSPFDAPRHSHRSGNPEPFGCPPSFSPQWESRAHLMPPSFSPQWESRAHLMPPVILTAVGIQSPFDAPRHSHRSGNPEPFRCANAVMARKIRQVGGQAFPPRRYSAGRVNHSIGIAKSIAGVPPASGIPHHHPLFHQARNVPQGGILRALCNPCPY